MSITEELRTKFALRLAEWKMAREEFDEYTAIADRIDAKYGIGMTNAFIHGLESMDYLYGRIIDLEARVARIERLLNHKGAE